MEAVLKRDVISQLPTMVARNAARRSTTWTNSQQQIWCVATLNANWSRMTRPTIGLCRRSQLKTAQIQHRLLFCQIYRLKDRSQREQRAIHKAGLLRRR